MIEAAGADFGYRDKKTENLVVRGLDLTLETGQVMCLVGANGAGKTTVIRTLIGSLPLLGGNVLIDGAHLADLTKASLAARIAYVPQNHIPPFPYSVFQVVEMGRLIHTKGLSSPKESDRKAAEYALGRLGIEDLKDRTYTEISGGERQMVLIARALAQESDYILMDEPADGLDYGNTVRLLEMIRDLAGDGKGILAVMHDPEQILQLDCDITVILGQSEFLTGKSREILEPPLLKRLYGVDIEMHDWNTSAGTSVRSIHAVRDQG